MGNRKNEIQLEIDLLRANMATWDIDRTKSREAVAIAQKVRALERELVHISTKYPVDSL